MAPSVSTAFVAGAGGAIGRVLCRLLVADGWHVVGTTRRAGTAENLRLIGVEPVILDVFDREALIRAVVGAAPNVVVHQLTDLPRAYTREGIEAAKHANARVRELGTANLIEAAGQSTATRVVAQSLGFVYASGQRPYIEEAPLDPSATAVASLESSVLGSRLEGVVLRYGRLYGPRTWFEMATGESPVHVDAAADAARRAMVRGATGVYNVAEDRDGVLSITRAKRELGWDPDFRTP
jgi:nucleoside-diphosphate-sugar epimerase